MLRYFNLQWKSKVKNQTMQCVVYWNGNTLFFTLCPLWNDISWWRNTQDPESEWFTQSWRMSQVPVLQFGHNWFEPRHLAQTVNMSYSPPRSCSHVLVMKAVILHEDEDVRRHTEGKVQSLLTSAMCPAAATAGTRPRGGGSPLHSGAASGSPEH